MASDRQIEANKANALKSTGPKTAQGKAIASRNALKHGMACQKENLLTTDERLYKERLDRWTQTAKPRNDMELYQLESAVRATVNLDRCGRNEKAAMKRRTRGVIGHWDGAQTKKLNRVTEQWTTEPAVCIAQLEVFTRGCEWLLERWELLGQALEANQCWTLAEAETAIRLLGECPETVPDGDSDGEVAAFRLLVVAALPDIDPDEADQFLQVDTSQLEPEARRAQLVKKLPTHEDALEGLWAALGAEMERVASIREKLWGTDEPALTEKIDLASFDSSKKGALRRRYQSANHLDMHRCLKEFSEQRRQTDIRAEEQRELDEKARAVRMAAIHEQTSKLMKTHHLRNEAKSSDTRDRRISTSGKSASPDPRLAMDPAAYIQKITGTKEAAPAGAPPSVPVAQGAKEAQKSS